MDHLSGSAFGKISIEKGQMVAAIFPQDKWSVPTGNDRIEIHYHAIYRYLLVLELSTTCLTLKSQQTPTYWKCHHC